MAQDEQAKPERGLKEILEARETELKSFEKANSNNSSWYMFTAVLAIILLAGAIAMMVMHCHGCKDNQSCSTPMCMPMQHHGEMRNCGMAMCMPMRCDGNMPCGRHEKDCCDKMPQHGHGMAADSNKCAHDSTKCCMEDGPRMPMPCVVYMPGNNGGCTRTPCIVYLAAAIIILLVIAVIIALMLSGKSSKSADKYRDGLIVLNDLEIAIALANQLDDNTSKTIWQPKIETEEPNKTPTPEGAKPSTVEDSTKKNIKTSIPVQVVTKEPERTNAIKEIIEKLLDRCS